MSYSVSSSGRMSVSLGNMASGTGQLTSNNTGYIDYYVQNQTLRNEIVKVSDAGAMQGTWSGNLGDHSVSFDVDNSGVVQNFSGIAGPVSGKFFSHNGFVAGFLRTGLPESNRFNQIGINGNLSGNALSGFYETDANEVPLESFSLSRQGGSDPIPELTDREKADIIFNWLESLFPDLLKPSPQQTQELSGIIFRYYPGTNVYLTTFQDHLFFIDHLGNVHDLGEVDCWLEHAQ